MTLLQKIVLIPNLWHDMFRPVSWYLLLTASFHASFINWRQISPDLKPVQSLILLRVHGFKVNWVQSDHMFSFVNHLTFQLKILLACPAFSYQFIPDFNGVYNSDEMKINWSIYISWSLWTMNWLHQTCN